VSNETIWILYSFRSYLGWQLEASGNELASGIHARSLWVSRNDYLLRRLPSKEVSMNEVEFVLRRILKVGHEYAQKEYEEKRHRPGVEKYYLNRYTAQVHLLQHLENQFLERNKNGKQD
jgi:hypothetical protein